MEASSTFPAGDAGYPVVPRSLIPPTVPAAFLGQFNRRERNTSHYLRLRRTIVVENYNPRLFSVRQYVFYFFKLFSVLNGEEDEKMFLFVLARQFVQRVG